MRTQRTQRLQRTGTNRPRRMGAPPSVASDPPRHSISELQPARRRPELAAADRAAEGMAVGSAVELAAQAGQLLFEGTAGRRLLFGPRLGLAAGRGLVSPLLFGLA